MHSLEVDRGHGDGAVGPKQDGATGVDVSALDSEAGRMGGQSHSKEKESSSLGAANQWKHRARPQISGTHTHAHRHTRTHSPPNATHTATYTLTGSLRK